MNNSKDTILINKKWEFDSNVANCFEDMLSRSIPQYDVMRKSILDLASIKIDKMLNRYLVEDLNKSSRPFKVLDIGCSDGLQISDFLHKYSSGYYMGIDVSDPMLDKARERFSKQIQKGQIVIANMDLRKEFPEEHFDIITSTLCIQFTPIEYRQDILSNVYNSLNHDGLFLMVEKILGETSTLNNMFTTNYYNLKSANGYSQEQIDRKRLSLEGVLVPCTNKWNIELLHQAGFRQVDVFWRWMNFTGYIAIK